MMTREDLIYFILNSNLPENGTLSLPKYQVDLLQDYLMDLIKIANNKHLIRIK